VSDEGAGVGDGTSRAATLASDTGVGAVEEDAGVDAGAEDGDAGWAAKTAPGTYVSVDAMLLPSECERVGTGTADAVVDGAAVVPEAGGLLEPAAAPEA